MKARLVLEAIAVLLVTSCAAVSAMPGRETSERRIPQGISLVAALADPGRYDGGLVEVVGYACGPRGAPLGLFLTRSDCEDGNFGNAIALTFDASSWSPAGPINLVSVRGVFVDRTHLIWVDEAYTLGEIRANRIVTHRIED
jgi:hypothetical protein